MGLFFYLKNPIFLLFFTIFLYIYLRLQFIGGMKIMSSQENRIIITRKYELIPCASNTSEWLKKVMNYTKDNFPQKISYYEAKLEKAKNKDEKAKIQQRLDALYAQQKIFEEEGNITNQNIIDYTYDLVRRAMESEARRKNITITYVYSELQNQHAMDMDIKERNKLINALVNECCRVKGSKKGSILDKVDINNPLGGYGIAFSQSLNKEIKDMVNIGHVLTGGSSILSYKLDSPFTIAKDHMNFSHDYESYEELYEHIHNNDCQLYFDFGANGKSTIARFQINLGSNRHKKNKEELISTLLKVYSGEYQFCGSSIGIEKNKIILNLSMSIPQAASELDENIVVGVDLGIAIPAMCSLNNNLYERLAIGSADDFLRVRTKIQGQRKRLQESLKNTSGGHGRVKKLEALERLKKAEAHFVETYCHLISKRVVDFALKHHAKYINIENLTGYDTSDFILRNWSYYKLQQYITYKADKYGIIVRKINPCYTSQVCSVCGNWHPENRPKGSKGQAYFDCHNPECKTHNPKFYKRGVNADFNASRNIAMSTLWMENGQVTEKSKQEARLYYGIPDTENIVSDIAV